MIVNKITRSFLLVLFLSSCFGGDSPFIYHDILPLQEEDDRIYPLKTLHKDKNIDVVMVIDNSGSMGMIQNNVIKNAAVFFQQFAMQPLVNWKLGIISTDTSDGPYLGFNKSFDSSIVDRRDPTSFDRTVEIFRSAVDSLGVGGSFREVTFYNLKRMLDRYSADDPGIFLRPNSHLVVIMVTDEKEQSQDEYGISYEAISFYKTMKKRIDPSKILRFYGAFDNKGFENCSNAGYKWKGSQFEKIITESEGFAISACAENFGDELAKIGEDIVDFVGLPSLLLKRRPKIETIEVYYRGELLKGGLPEEGGLWYYEESTNTINFYHMDFIIDIENDTFRVDFDVDDGVHRD